MSNIDYHAIEKIMTDIFNECMKEKYMAFPNQFINDREKQIDMLSPQGIYNLFPGLKRNNNGKRRKF